MTNIIYDSIPRNGTWEMIHRGVDEGIIFHNTTYLILHNSLFYISVSSGVIINYYKSRNYDIAYTIVITKYTLPRTHFI